MTYEDGYIHDDRYLFYDSDIPATGTYTPGKHNDGATEYTFENGRFLYKSGFYKKNGL